ncbi:MAG: DNA primase, partial [Marinirhabdus sp.]
EEERYRLHKWDGRNIFVKDKKEGISQLVSETILNLRRELVAQKINELAQQINGEKEAAVRGHHLETIRDYTALRLVLSEKLRRVL